MTYRNIFAELGYAQTEIDKKVADGWRTIFEGKERFYFEGPEETGYMMDTGNIDARTEGMSYGMMIAVQMDRKDIFDRIWKWSRTYMFMNEGKHKGYFAWSCAPDGKKNAFGPAPDGEEYFAAALYFASGRWGDGEGILDYSAQATALLQTCLHQGEREGDSKESRPMWDSENHLIRFVPEVDFSDPSYHLPHFYEIFGERAAASDRNFWKKAAEASRDYIALSCHPATGLAPEYAAFDGKPVKAQWSGQGDDFFSDSYRVALNIGLDALWQTALGKTPDARLSGAAGRIARFFAGKDAADFRRYAIDGTPKEEAALHPVALIATNAATAPSLLGLDGAAGRASAERTPADAESRLSPEAAAEKAVRLFWDTPMRSGPRRYYDNCLHFFALLILSGRYRIY